MIQNLTVGRVLEPKVFFEVGKVDFGPLLLSGKNKETVKLAPPEAMQFSRTLFSLIWSHQIHQDGYCVKRKKPRKDRLVLSVQTG